jgi:hypothetical protein
MVTRSALVDADMRVASFRERVKAYDLHFFPARTCGRFSAAWHQQTLKCRHGVYHLHSEAAVLKHRPKQPVSENGYPGHVYSGGTH